ncbi:MAG: phosphoglucosamine mutase [Candidatus Aminicenantia bacterium]
MPRYFGTDGIRGKPGEFPLDSSSIYWIGYLLTQILSGFFEDIKIVIGMDTRGSSKWIEKLIYAGIRDGGGEALLTDIIPTSALSFLIRKFNFSAGVSISASHNPSEENGIKIFDWNGVKLEERIEEEIEKELLKKQEFGGRILNETNRDENLRNFYLEFLKSHLYFPVPKKFKIVVDCSNGAASSTAPLLFKELGLEVISINSEPDGSNINLNCGSTHPQVLSKAVIENSANMGVAYDGDADRAIWSDEKGRILDGDHTLYLMGKFMKERNLLSSNSIVATVMSNLGLELSLKREGLNIVRTSVGDKNVYNEMVKIGTNLGGEQSGHTIFLDSLPTGDGILTTIMLLNYIFFEEKPLSDLSVGIELFPQVIKNVKVREKISFSEIPGFTEEMDKIKVKLGEDGRIVVRYSGTESKLRIMIEGKDEKEITEMAENLADIVYRKIGG